MKTKRTDCLWCGCCVFGCVVQVWVLAIESRKDKERGKLDCLFIYALLYVCIMYIVLSTKYNVECTLYFVLNTIYIIHTYNKA